MQQKIAFVGVQWGDEGKGKVLHHAVSCLVGGLSLGSPDLQCRAGLVAVERHNGGCNAGHTLYHNGSRIVLHYIPSGILYPQMYNLCSAGMYLNPSKLMGEIQELQQQGIAITPENCGIAANAHITLQHHVDSDQAALQQERHTSTGNGIRQTAADKYARIGMRFIEFLNKEVMADCLKRMFPDGVPLQYEGYGQYAAKYEKERRFLAPFLVQDHQVRQFKGSRYWLLEGAQGVMLDIDAGNYPGTTSSQITQFPIRPDTVVGVAKLYCSSVGVGDRPFVSQLPADLEEKVRQEWGEFGSTTGKPRSLGWFDAVAARYAAEVADVDYLAGTCGDRLETLAKLDVKPEIVIAYEIDGKKYDTWDVLFHRRDVLHKARPITEKFEPWKSFTEPDQKTLTPAAQRYIDRIEHLVGKKFCMLGTGPQRDDVIVYENIFRREEEEHLRK